MIQYKILNDNKPKEYFRNYNNISGRQIWKNSIQEVLPCHWGQRKLFYSELEFLSIVSKHIDLTKCLIVYIGAADGSHHKLLHKYFKNVSFLLYDMRPYANGLDKLDNYILKTGDDGFFTDDKINEVLKIANSRKIIYICDIRDIGLNSLDEFAAENAVWENMLQQQRWGLLMDAEFMLLKFRLPYNLEDMTIGFDYDISKFNDKLIIDETKINNPILYLKGDIYTQLYEPKRSTETRLLVSKIKYYNDKSKYDKKEHEKYVFKKYDYIEYEEVLNFFNLHERYDRFFYKNSKDTTNHLMGFDESYDNVGEYYICDLYLQNVKKEKYEHKRIINMIYEINHFFIKENKRTIALCVPKYILKTIIDKMSILKNVKDVIIFNEQYNKIEILIKLLFNVCFKVKKSYEEQIKLIKKSNILTKSEIEKELNLNKKLKINFKEHILIEINDKNEINVDRKYIEILFKLLKKIKSKFKN